jgi:SAM-dependent methyltransferase
MVTMVDPTYLRTVAQAPAIRAIKDRAYDLLRLGPGVRVLDVGCGPAIDTVPMARRVGPTGLVLGIDRDPATIEEANRTATREGVGAFTRHSAGEATALGLAADAVDAVYCERVLQHISWIDARQVVREIVRVVRPGGRVVVVDTDWATLSIAADDPWLERRVVSEHWLGFANPFSGRHLPPLARASGLVDVAVETFDLPLTLESVEFLLAPALQRGAASGRIGVREAERWYLALRGAHEYGLFFAHVSMVLAAGTIG